MFHQYTIGDLRRDSEIGILGGVCEWSSPNAGWRLKPRLWTAPAAAKPAFAGSPPHLRRDLPARADFVA